MSYLLIEGWVYTDDDTGGFEGEVLARFELIMSHLNWPSVGHRSGKGVFASVQARDLGFIGNSHLMFHIHGLINCRYSR